MIGGWITGHKFLFAFVVLDCQRYEKFNSYRYTKCFFGKLSIRKIALEKIPEATEEHPKESQPEEGEQ